MSEAPTEYTVTKTIENPTKVKIPQPEVVLLSGLRRSLLSMAKLLEIYMSIKYGVKS